MERRSGEKGWSGDRGRGGAEIGGEEERRSGTGAFGNARDIVLVQKDDNGGIQPFIATNKMKRTRRGDGR